MFSVLSVFLGVVVSALPIACFCSLHPRCHLYHLFINLSTSHMCFFGMYSNGIGLAQMSSGSPLLPSPMARCCIISGKDSGASERPCANATTLTVRNERPQTSASLSFRDEPCCVALALDADEQPSNWGGGMQF